MKELRFGFLELHWVFQNFLFTRSLPIYGEAALQNACWKNVPKVGVILLIYLHI